MQKTVLRGHPGVKKSFPGLKFAKFCGKIHFSTKIFSNPTRNASNFTISVIVKLSTF